MDFAGMLGGVGSAPLIECFSQSGISRRKEVHPHFKLWIVREVDEMAPCRHIRLADLMGETGQQVSKLYSIYSPNLVRVNSTILTNTHTAQFKRIERKTGGQYE